MSKLKQTVRDVSQRSSLVGIIVSVMGQYATVRLSGGGRYLHGIPCPVTVAVGDKVTIVYSNGLPSVQANLGVSNVKESEIPLTPTPTYVQPVYEKSDASFDQLSVLGWGIDENNCLSCGGTLIYDDGKIEFYDSATLMTRLGDLNGVYGYSSTIYGAAFGNYATDEPNLTIDPDNGLRIRLYNTTVMEFAAGEAAITGSMSITGELLFGSGAGVLNSSGIILDAIIGGWAGSSIMWYESTTPWARIGPDVSLAIFQGLYISSLKRISLDAETDIILAPASPYEVMVDGPMTITENLCLDGGIYAGSRFGTAVAGTIKATNDIIAGKGLYVGTITGTAIEDCIIADGYIKASGDGSSYGVFVGTDTQLYRQAANVLRTPDDFWGDADIRLTGGMYIGSQATDPGAGKLITTSDVNVGGGMYVGGVTGGVQDDNVLVYGGIYAGHSAPGVTIGTGTICSLYSMRAGSCLVVGSYTQAPPSDSALAMFKEQDTQGTIPSGYGAIYAATTGWPMWKNDTGALVPMFKGRMYIPIFSGLLTSASQTSINGHPVLGMAATGSSISDVSIPMPKGWVTAGVTPKINLWWAPVDTGSGNVVFDIELYPQKHGSVLAASACSYGSVTSAAPAVAYKVVKETVTLTAWSGVAEGDSLWVRVYRDGNNGSDTYANVIGLLSVELSVID